MSAAIVARLRKRAEAEWALAASHAARVCNTDPVYRHAARVLREEADAIEALPAEPVDERRIFNALIDAWFDGRAGFGSDGYETKRAIAEAVAENALRALRKETP